MPSDQEISVVTGKRKALAAIAGVATGYVHGAGTLEPLDMIAHVARAAAADAGVSLRDVDGLFAGLQTEFLSTLAIGEYLGIRPRFSDNNRLGGSSFDAADQQILTLIAGQASKAIVIARARRQREQSGRLASVGQMMSGVMHDLKTPMTIVSGYAQLMATSDDPKARDAFAETILKQLDLMSAMAREVLQFARGESTLLVRKVYLTKFAEELRQQLEREFAGRDVTLEIDLRHRGVADFDELRLYRLAHNLARNANHAMDGKGTFKITIDLDDRGIQFAFSDTGRGLSEAIQKRLFQAFATEGKSDGTGLGLAIVKKIVDDHGGTIRYETGAGEGTTFFITLPSHKRVDTPGAGGGS